LRPKTGPGLISILLLTAGGYLFLKRRSQPISAHQYLENQGALAMAHRGGQGLWPPNTIYAFEHATNICCDILELDICTAPQKSDTKIILLSEQFPIQPVESTKVVQTQQVSDNPMLSGFACACRHAQ